MDPTGSEGSTVLSNALIALEFSHQGSLTCLRHLKEGFAFRLAFQPDGRVGDRGLWQVVLRAEGGRCVVANPEQPPTIMTQQGDSLRIEWTQPVEDTDMHVAVDVSLEPDSPLSSWRCEVQYSGPLAIWEVTCPRLAGLRRILADGASDRLAIPWQYGGLVPDPIQCISDGGSHAYGISMDYGYYGGERAIGANHSRVAYSYPGMWSLQFLAFYNPEYGGIYLAAHDPSALYKRFGLYGDTGGDVADLVMQHYPAERIQPGLHYTTPYDTIVGLFKGEWWTASAFYRKWAIGQEWCRKGPLLQRDDIPEWLLDTDIWYWNWRPKERLGNHGRPDDLVPAILDLTRRLDANIAFHWYEWDSRCFNAQMPEIIPLAEAERTLLLHAVEALHAAGVRTIPYINGRLWTTNHPGWERDGASLACRTPEGQVAWYDNHEGMAQICPYTRRWQEIQKDICKYIVSDCGLDGAYIDQVTSCYAVPCFADNHGHPRGGGSSWYIGYRQMMEAIQENCKALQPDAAFTSESTIDCYLDLFDANLAREASELSDAHGEQWLPIPLFHSVYHDYAITYGSVLLLVEQFPDAYYYGEALILTGGQQLMVEDYMAWDVGTDNYAPYLEYLGKLVRARQLAKRFLLYGTWMPPVPMSVDKVEVRWSARHPAKRNIPAVLSSVWRLGDEVCLVLVNHTDRDRKVDYALSVCEYGLPEGQYRLYELSDQREMVRLQTASRGLISRSHIVGARSARVYVMHQ